MLLVRDITVRFVSIQVLGLEWQIEDTFEAVEDYRFLVFGSTAPEGPYVQLSPELTDTYAFHVNVFNPYSRTREFYYRVRVLHAATGDYTDYGSMDPYRVLHEGAPPGGVSIEAPPDLVTLEVRRQKELELREYTGRKVLWFPRRTFGRRCSCIDALTRKPTLDRCPSCYGSQYLGGFLNPVELWMRIGGPIEEQDLNTWMGTLQPSQSVARTVVHYRLKPRDMVVEVEGARWLVERVRFMDRLRARVHADYVLSRLNPDNIEHELFVDWDRGSLAASPARNFLPCVDVESYRAEAARRGLT